MPSDQVSSPQDAWTDLCAVDHVELGKGLYVERGGHDLAVLRLGDNDVSVLHNRCPHAGGSLASGWVQDGCITCPWHGWTFDVHTGQCPDAPQIAVPRYPVRVLNGRVQARLNSPGATALK